jgi:hypothetical protein
MNTFGMLVRAQGHGISSGPHGITVQDKLVIVVDPVDLLGAADALRVEYLLGPRQKVKLLAVNYGIFNVMLDVYFLR